MTNIIMPVRNRLKLTRQALDSLSDHTDPKQYKLVCVDDDSDDFRVRHVLRDYGVSVITIHNSLHVLSQVKNLGVMWSEQQWGRGDYLCICDNDVYFKEGWLERMIKLAECTCLLGFKIWGGQAHPYHLPVGHGMCPGGGYRNDWSEHDCLAGTHWFMRWSTWEDYGPFDRTTAPGVGQSEDYAFTQRIKAKGGRIGVASPHVVIDCGWTNTNGERAPGWEARQAAEGVYYE